MALRSGAWLTERRIRLYGLMLIGAYALTVLTVLLSGTGPLDGLGRLIGTDFSQIWIAGRRGLAGRTVVLEQGTTGWEKIQSTFSAVRMWGGTVEAAYAAQAVVSGLVLLGAARLWSGRADRRLAYAALPAASLLALVWAAPLLTRSVAGAVGLLLGLFAVAGFFGLVLGRAAVARR